MSHMSKKTELMMTIYSTEMRMLCFVDQLSKPLATTQRMRQTGGAGE